jgi:hypothetical protein
MENRDVLSQPDSSAGAGCRRRLLRRLCSPCISLRARAVLSPYHDRSSGHRRHCPQWRRLSQPRGSPKRCSQSLQPDDLGRRRLGVLVRDMVCSRRSSENSRSDLPVGPVTMVSEKTGDVAERGAGSARGVEAAVSAPQRAHRAKQAKLADNLTAGATPSIRIRLWYSQARFRLGSERRRAGQDELSVRSVSQPDPRQEIETLKNARRRNRCARC